MTKTLTAQQWRVLLATGLLFALTSVDFYGSAIALPAIGRAFRASGVEVEWVMNANLLAYAALLITVGRLTDMFGPRAMAIAGALVFGSGAAMVASSPVFAVLFVGRAAQGLGDALITIAAFDLLANAFEGRSRGTGVGLMAATGVGGALVGPFLSGALTDGLSWRWFYFVVTGATAVGLVLALLFADKVPSEDGQRKLDVPGALLLTAAVLLLIVGLQLIDTDGWLAPKVLGCILAGVLCLLVFYFVERRAASPLMDFTLFREPTFSGICVVLFLFAFPFGALMVYLALYLQHVLGYSALQSGAIYLAMLVPTAAIALNVNRVLQRAGPQLTLTVSTALMTVGFVSFGFVHPTTGVGLVIVGLALVGCGKGMSGPVPMALGLSSVSKAKAGLASAMLMTVGAIAVPVGIAAFGAFFRVWENDQLAHIFRVAGSGLDAQTKSDVFGLLSGSDMMKTKLASIAPEIASRVELVAGEAFSHAFRNVMFLSIGVFVAMTVYIQFLKHEGADSSEHHNPHKH